MLTYDPPRILRILTTEDRPIVGGFSVEVQGQNFYPGATTVTIGEALCSNVVIEDGLAFGVLRCTAPPGPGIGNVQLTVMVAGYYNASVPFMYMLPAVTGVSLTVCAADAAVVIKVSGTNLGRRNSASSPDPVVFIGDSLCGQPVLLSATLLQCTAPVSAVGAYPVVVSLNGHNGTTSAVLHRLCGPGTFGLPGNTCDKCPQNAECVALFPLPLPRPGFFANTWQNFTSCVPASACPGVDSTAVQAAFTTPALSGVLRMGALHSRAPGASTCPPCWHG